MRDNTIASSAASGALTLVTIILLVLNIPGLVVGYHLGKGVCEDRFKAILCGSDPEEYSRYLDSDFEWYRTHLVGDAFQKSASYWYYSAPEPAILGIKTRDIPEPVKRTMIAELYFDEVPISDRTVSQHMQAACALPPKYPRTSIILFTLVVAGGVLLSAMKWRRKYNDLWRSINYE